MLFDNLTLWLDSFGKQFISAEQYIFYIDLSTNFFGSLHSINRRPIWTNGVR
jgi:hypothetical protein